MKQTSEKFRLDHYSSDLALHRKMCMLTRILLLQKEKSIISYIKNYKNEEKETWLFERTGLHLYIIYLNESIPSQIHNTNQTWRALDT